MRIQFFNRTVISSIYQQYLEVMNWKEPNPFNIFVTECFALRKKYEQLCLILEIMMGQSDLECFQKFQIQSFKQRFKLELSQEKFKQSCQGLIDKSCLTNRTVHYDYFQYYTNGIQP